MTLTSAEPGLYSVADDGTPVLRGVRDTTGFVSFPHQTFGSERTGEHGDALEEVTFSGRGTIAATARVNFHADPSVTTPYTVASIVLAEGPMVRGLLAGGGHAQIGDTVTATTVATGEGEETVHQLRFVLTEAGVREDASGAETAGHEAAGHEAAGVEEEQA